MENRIFRVLRNVAVMLLFVSVLDASEVLPNQNGYGKGWKALMVRATRGDRDACATFKKSILSDRNWWNNEMVWRDILLIRQPESVELFSEMLFSDWSIEGHDGRRMLYAYYAIRYLDKLLIGFPVSREGDVIVIRTAYSEQDLELARKWMNEHRGEWLLQTEQDD